YSDLHLLIFDISNTNFETHIKETIKLLEEVGASFVPQIIVFNKIDKVHEEYLLKLKEKYPDFIFISAKNKINIDILKGEIKKTLLKYENKS
ncbi:MAG: GTPase HflX, partial [Candidatus Calescibacterium sp.]|nr:GTPase HflX [Candidatus Calescibacterium sp.]